MPRYLIVFCMAVLVLSTGCSKNNVDIERSFYGTWVKGSNPGDTLFFMRDGSKNMLRYPVSLTGAAPGYKSVAYKYQKNKLWAAVLGGPPMELNSFNWLQREKSFSLSGNDLYPYLSSIVGPLTYTKIP